MDWEGKRRKGKHTDGEEGRAWAGMASRSNGFLCVGDLLWRDFFFFQEVWLFYAGEF